MQVRGSSTQGNESCLFLNIFAPEKSQSSAVLLYIHGGSYVSGGIKDMFNGTHLVELGDLIVVTIQYRLGILGFAGSKELRERDEGQSSGNYGIQDQRAAMKWVQDNIGQFGGNKNNVMIVGESAGAGSIAVHLTSPKSWPYYHKAVMQSGAFSYWDAQPFSDAEKQYQDLVEVTACKEGGLECLLQVPATALVGMSTMALDPEALPELWKAFGTFFSPTVDGVELTGLPWDLLDEGKFNKEAAVMMGFNKDEGTVITAANGRPSFALVNKTFNMTRQDFETLLTRDIFNLTSAQLSTALDIYNNSTYGDWYWALAAIFGDYEIDCPTLRSARSMTKSGKDVFVYRFSHTPLGEPAPTWAGLMGKTGTYGATHASELGFTWLGGDGWNSSKGASEGGWPLNGTAEWVLAHTMAQSWINFAKTADPNHLAKANLRGTQIREMQVSWKPFNPEHDVAMDFDLPNMSTIHYTAYERRCAFMDQLGPMVEGYVTADWHDGRPKGWSNVLADLEKENSARRLRQLDVVV